MRVRSLDTVTLNGSLALRAILAWLGRVSLESFRGGMLRAVDVAVGVFDVIGIPDIRILV